MIEPDDPRVGRGATPLDIYWLDGPPSFGATAPVVVTGVFDVLHLGHVRFLNRAAARRQPLYVGVEADNRVRAWKGPHRPIHRLAERTEMLASLKAVTKVFSIHGDPEACTVGDYVAVLRRVGPFALAHTASDPHAEAKRQGAEALGAEIWELPLDPGYSTTALLERIRA